MPNNQLSTKFVTSHRMIDAIVAEIKENGECRVFDLKLAGLTGEDINRYWNSDYALAAVEIGSNYQGDEDDKFLSSLLIA